MGFNRGGTSIFLYLRPFNQENLKNNKMKKRILQILGVAVVVTLGLASCSTDACKDVVCENGGTCVEGDCECPEGFGGADCATNYCATLPCSFGGTTRPISGGCECICEAGYSGTDCTTEWRERFIGNYNVSETCGSDMINYAISITGAVDVTNVVIENFGNLSINVVAYLSTVGTVLSLNTINGNREITGSGYLAGDVLTITYTITEGSDSYSCTMTGDKL